MVSSDQPREPSRTTPPVASARLNDAGQPGNPLVPWLASLGLHALILLLIAFTADKARLGLGNSPHPGGTAGGGTTAHSGDDSGDAEVPLAMVVHRITPQDWLAADPTDPSAADQPAASDRSSHPTADSRADSPPRDETTSVGQPPPIAAPIDLDGVLQQLLASAEPGSGDLTSGSVRSGTGGDHAPLRDAIPGATGQQPASSDRGFSSAAAGSGRPASLFGVEGSGSRVVYVVDRSDSMNALQGRPLVAAKAELIRSLGALESMQFFQLVLYNNQPSAYRNPFAGGTIQMVQGEPRAIEKAQEYIETFGAFGGTDHLAALRMALRMNPDVVFFLSDGLVPGLNQQELAEINRLAASRGVTIHCIEFGTDPAPHPHSFLSHLAAGNRGQYRYLDVNRFTDQGDWKPAVGR